MGLVAIENKSWMTVDGLREGIEDDLNGNSITDAAMSVFDRRWARNRDPDSPADVIEPAWVWFRNGLRLKIVGHSV
jgi:hypothetical protein